MKRGTTHRKLKAILFFCCIAIYGISLISLPFHNLLHQSSKDSCGHIEKYGKEKNIVAKPSHYHECFACVVSKIDNTPAKFCDLILPTLAYLEIHFENSTSKYFFSLDSSNSRSPPINIS